MADPLFKKDAAAKQRLASYDQGGSFFFYIGLLLFLVSLASYGGLTLLNRAQDRARLELLEQVKLKEAELRPELLNDIFLLEERLNDLKLLLANHKFNTKVIKFLEENTHPQVAFGNFSFSSKTGRLSMAGTAPSFTTIAQQIGIFERSPFVREVQFGGLSANSKDNNASFNVTIIFNDELTAFSR